MLENKTIMIKWGHRNKNTYENKGYIFTKHGDEFEVKIEDLTDTARGMVDIQCDGCETILKDINWGEYKRYVKENGKYYCKNCAANGYKKWVSFYQWCYDNLPKELADYILSRWDYKLNVDKNGKTISPKDITYGSAGFSHKGYWFMCLDHPEHGSELKSIIHLTTRNNKIDCNKCNSVSITYPEYIKFFVNKDDMLKYPAHSNKNILMKCPSCGNQKEMTIHNLTSQGFSCPKCGDGISYPEKFLFNFLEQLCINFETQLGNKVFNWCGKYRYDNYIEKINCICETHGLQHYKDTTGTWNGISLKGIKENDKQKEQLAKNNNIKHYIVLDCRYSELEWLKNSIIESDLPKLLNFKESDIDWLKCHESGYKSFVKIVSDLWNDGIKNLLQIASKLKISKSATTKYLKQGAELGWCDYNAYEESKKNTDRLKKSVICVTTGDIFTSIIEASNKYKVNENGISQCCNNKTKSAGKHPVTGEKMVWKFYNKGEIIND